MFVLYVWYDIHAQHAELDWASKFHKITINWRLQNNISNSPFVLFFFIYSCEWCNLCSISVHIFLTILNWTSTKITFEKKGSAKKNYHDNPCTKKINSKTMQLFWEFQNGWHQKKLRARGLKIVLDSSEGMKK